MRLVCVIKSCSIQKCYYWFYKNISRTSAVSPMNFGSILIFASCVVGTCSILCGWVFVQAVWLCAGCSAVPIENIDDVPTWCRSSLYLPVDSSWHGLVLETDWLLWAWCNPGSTRDLQQLIVLSFVAFRTRQVGARFDFEPSEGNYRNASRQEHARCFTGRTRVDIDHLSKGNGILGITRLSFTRLDGDSTTTTTSTTRQHDIQPVWNG